MNPGDRREPVFKDEADRQRFRRNDADPLAAARAGCAVEAAGTPRRLKSEDPNPERPKINQRQRIKRQENTNGVKPRGGHAAIRGRSRYETLDTENQTATINGTPKSSFWRFPNLYWLYVVTHCDTGPKLEDPIKDPARFPWHEIKKVEHYRLDVNAMTQPMELKEDAPPYGGGP